MLLTGAVTRGLGPGRAAALTDGRVEPNAEPWPTEPLATAPGRPLAVFSRVTPPEVVTPAPNRVFAAMWFIGATTGPLARLVRAKLATLPRATLLFTRLNDATWKPDRAKNGSPCLPYQ